MNSSAERRQPRAKLLGRRRLILSRAGLTASDEARRWDRMSTLERVLNADREDPDFDYAAH